MTRPLRNLISAVTLAALTGLLVLAATQWTDVFFRFYPSFSRWILGVLAGITSVTSFPLWEPGLCLIVLWGIISLIRSLVHHHFLRWLSGLLLTLCFAAFFFMTVWGLNYFAPPMSERLGMETQERTAAELREVTWRDLDEGVLLGLTQTLHHLKQTGKQVCSASAEARAYLLRERKSL